MIVEGALDDWAGQAQAAISGFPGGQSGGEGGGDGEQRVGGGGKNDEHQRAVDRPRVDGPLIPQHWPSPDAMHIGGGAEKDAGNPIMAAGEAGGAAKISAATHGAKEPGRGENQLKGSDDESAHRRTIALFPDRRLAIDRKALGDWRGTFGAERIGGNAIDDIAAFFAEKCGFFGNNRGDASHCVMVHLEIAEVRIQNSEADPSPWPSPLSTGARG